MNKICKWCGKEYESASLKRKYCSDMCARSAHSKKCAEAKKRRAEAKNEPKETHICVVCGKEFTMGRGHSICCSDECRKENARRRCRENYYTRKTKKMHKCVVCGTEFEARGSLKVCSDKCREIRDKDRQKQFWESYKSAYKQKKKEYEARLKEQQQPMFDGKVLHRAEMTVDEYNRKHGTNYSYGQYVFYVESKGVK